MSKQLGLNPEMDGLARDNGLEHWTCVSPFNGDLWVRSDGVTASIYDAFEMKVKTKTSLVTIVDFKSGWEALKLVDETYPIGEDWQKPTTDLPEQQTLVQKPFDIMLALALMSERNSKNIIRTSKGVPVYSFGEIFPEKGSIEPRYSTKTTGGFEVVYTNSMGKSLDGNSDNDLIIFVWE